MTRAGGLVGRLAKNPVRLVPVVFLAGMTVGTVLLMLPAARAGDQAAPLLVALFTATSAVCTTGLVVQETATYWTGFGKAVIMVLTQVGGFGIITVGTLLVLLTARQLGVRTRLIAQAEGAGVGLANPRRLLTRIAAVVVTVEAAVALVVGLRLWISYGYPPGTALWYAIFHSVQAFNNSGFALFPDDTLAPFVSDGWVCLPLTLGVIAGATGLPVILELGRWWRRPSRWSVTARLSVFGSLILLAAGFLVILVFEWNNAATLGPLDPASRVLAAFVQGTIPRSGGLSTLDFGEMREETLTFVIILMFIGGGSASTAGGIKVTTFFLLAYVIWSEVRGEPEVVIGRRRIAGATQRQALTVALLGLALAGLGTLLLFLVTVDVRLLFDAFEAISAFSTAGLSSGITPDLPAPAQIVLIFLMYVGRIGTVAAVSAIALAGRPRSYSYPEERPVVG